MNSDEDKVSPSEEAERDGQDDLEAPGGPVDETPDGFPICRWCGGAITEKDDLTVASDETGVPARIAPVGYTAPRSFSTYHRDCHLEASGEYSEEHPADATGFWTPVNLFVVGVALVIVLVVLYFALFPQ